MSTRTLHISDDVLSYREDGIERIRLFPVLAYHKLLRGRDLECVQ